MAEHEIRSGRGDGFTVLYNSMVKDDRLPLEAKGLFAYIMSRPPDWKFTVSGLAVSTGTGKDKIRRILAQLEQVGYLLREQGHKENGTFGGNVYVLQDFAPPLSENTDNGETRQREKTLTAFPTQPNKDYNPVKIKYNPHTPKTPGFVWDLIHSFVPADDTEYFEALEGLLVNREALKKPILTTQAMNKILNRLRKVNDRATEIAMLNKAVELNWLTVYPLKADELPGRFDSNRPEGYSREAGDTDGI